MQKGLPPRVVGRDMWYMVRWIVKLLHRSHELRVSQQWLFQYRQREQDDERYGS
jgi:hypothetical protein